MRRIGSRAMTAALGGLTVTALLGGCELGSGLYNADLPGGADLGSHPYTVQIQFADALDLVPQSGVRVNEVAVGKVTAISLNTDSDHYGQYAKVTVEINGSVRLPANAVASIEQTTLLGEKYVELAAPTSTPAVGTLANNAHIGQNRTSDGVETEQVLGALSLLLNGGGLGTLQDIYNELNQFQGNHQTEIQQFLASVDNVASAMNDHRTDITNALTALGTLSTHLAEKNSEITRLLQEFAPGIAELANQRTQIIGALNALNNLSTVTVDTLNQSQANIVADFQSLGTILQNLASAGTALPRSLQALFTYPFTDAAVAGIKGDYLNAWVTETLRFNNKDSNGDDNSSAPSAWPATTGAGPASSSASGSPSASPSPSAAPSTSPSTSAPNQPSGLLPPTTSAAPGLPSTITLPGSSSSASSAPGSASTSPPPSSPGSPSASSRGGQ